MIERSPSEVEPVSTEDLAAYESSMREGCMGWIVLTGASVITYMNTHDWFASSMLAPGGTGFVLFGEQLRHDRVKPYKALNTEQL